MKRKNKFIFMLFKLPFKAPTYSFPRNTQKSIKNQNEFILILNINKQSNLVVKKSC